MRRCWVCYKPIAKEEEPTERINGYLLHKNGKCNSDKTKNFLSQKVFV